MSERVRYGVCGLLESWADELITASLEGVTNREDKSDIMTPWKLKHRKTHEILTRSGAPVDPSVIRGQFTKAWNPEKPHLNSREGPTRAPKMSSSWDPEVGVATGALSSEMATVFGVERVDD